MTHDLVEQARAFAIAAHGDQKYGENPYSVHLDDVDAVLVEFGHDDPILRAAGQLHDVLEDTKVTYGQLMLVFLSTVSDIVYGVTDIPGINRAESHARTYPHVAGNLPRTIVKLADRIANVRRSKIDKPALLKMYRKEYPFFRHMLYTDAPEVNAMWVELDRLLLSDS